MEGKESCHADGRNSTSTVASRKASPAGCMLLAGRVLCRLHFLLGAYRKLNEKPQASSEITNQFRSYAEKAASLDAAGAGGKLHADVQGLVEAFSNTLRSVEAATALTTRDLEATGTCITITGIILVLSTTRGLTTTPHYQFWGYDGPNKM